MARRKKAVKLPVSVELVSSPAMTKEFNFPTVKKESKEISISMDSLHIVIKTNGAN